MMMYLMKVVSLRAEIFLWINELNASISNFSVLRSPGTPSAVDRFHSPMSQLCRSIFPSSGFGSLQQRQGTHLGINYREILPESTRI